MANYDHLLSQMTLILIILKYRAACDHLESNIESLTCILILANFGHKVANSGQPELLAAKISKSLGEVDVCEEFVTKQNSLRCAVLEIWVPHEKAVTGNYR